MNAADRLEQGADRIEQYGWFQARFGDGGGPWAVRDCPVGSRIAHCALTAIFSVDGNSFITDSLDPVRLSAEAALRQWVGDQCPARWNNAEGQTKANVIATMRACAAWWRAKNEVPTVLEQEAVA